MSAVLVRPEEPEDVAAVQDLVAAAFVDEPVADLLAALRGDTCWRDLSFVAQVDDGLAGHVSYTRGWVDAPDRLVEALVLSPLSVHPGRQGTGTGSALVRQSLAALADRPEPLVFLEGDPAFYGRLGFVAAGRYGLTPPSARIPPTACQVHPLPAYDRLATPATGALVYPDVFWRFDAVGLRD